MEFEDYYSDDRLHQRHPTTGCTMQQALTTTLEQTQDIELLVGDTRELLYVLWKRGYVVAVRTERP